jgi:adenine-specific DNA-methyltransferase
MKPQKLELTWIGKDARPRLEPRILLEDTTKSHHAKRRVSESDIFDNRLIFGDNLLALKALEQEFTGKVKCVYIDPPYNTGHAFKYYDDGIEHSIWLSLMRDRLEILRRLISSDGFIACHIDDSEGHYLKVLLDEVFGRHNYLTTFYVQVRYGQKTLAEDNDYQKVVEQVLIYSKDKLQAKANKELEAYKVEKFEWQIIEKSAGVQLKLGGKSVTCFQPEQYEILKIAPTLTGLKETWATGSLVRQTGSSGEFLDKYLAPRKTVDGLGCLYKVDGIGEDGLGFRYMTGPKKETATKGKFFSGIPLQTLEALKSGNASKGKPIQNFYDLAGSFGNCRHEGGVEFGGGKKPEVLLNLILKHFSNPGDLVLDSFGGSGTTGAVAHKMGRRWIMVELGEHCHTHIIPRLKKVIDGEDKGGVTEAAGWQGGGGFKYFSLAPSLLEKDRWGNWVISKAYNPAMLSQALCKLEGFTYAPSDTHYWQQGQSTETDFLYVTTQTLNVEMLQALSDEVGIGRTLLICCSAFMGSADRYPNLTLRKIPKSVMSKCEWGHDDYSLNVANLPMAKPVAAAQTATQATSLKQAKAAPQCGLFTQEA